MVRFQIFRIGLQIADGARMKPVGTRLYSSMKQKLVESTPIAVEGLTDKQEAIEALDKKNQVVEQFINNIMKDGKKEIARGIIADALLYIKHNDLKTDPKGVMLDAIEKASVYVKVSSQKRGAKVVMKPKPLTDRQRFRTAILWIRDAALSGKTSTAALGRGRESPLGRLSAAGLRIGREIMAVANGTSSVLQKKLSIHKLVLANRSNIVMTDRKKTRFS